MNILLTGATGFVGRVVAPSLAASGHFVRAALRSAVEAPSRETVVVGDLAPDTDWSKAVAGVDAVVHLAARVHVMRDHAGGGEEFRRVNSEGTLNLARAAAAAGARRFVFISSIKVNGERTGERPFRADDEPNPCDDYGRSKLEAERGLLAIPGLEPVIIRPPLVHGPGAKGNLARLCRLAFSGVPVPLGGIDNRRDLVGVDNLASLIERCLWHPAAAGRVFLAADGESISTSQLYRIIAAAFGRPARMFHVPVGLMRSLAQPFGLTGEINRLTQSLELDVTPTRELLEWTPPLRVEEGLSAMARAYAVA